MNADAARAWAFMRRGDIAGTREEPSPLGSAVFDERFPLRHDSNYLFVERRANADEVKRELARLALPVAIVPDERLVPDAEATSVLMVHRGPRAPAGSAAEVGHTALEPLRRAEILAAPWGSPEIADQLLAAKELLAQRVRLRCFAAFADGVVVSGTDLYEDGADGQIEDVATAPAYRGRGYGTDVVLTALAAAPEFCFLVARADDWPRRWYARLGFEPVGSYAKISAAT